MTECFHIMVAFHQFQRCSLKKKKTSKRWSFVFNGRQRKMLKSAAKNLAYVPPCPSRSVVSRGTCLQGSTSRTCSKTSLRCLCPSILSHPLRIWWSWSSSVEGRSAKLSVRQVSASGSTAAEYQRAAGSCLNSGCWVRSFLVSILTRNHFIC